MPAVCMQLALQGCTPALWSSLPAVPLHSFSLFHTSLRLQSYPRFPKSFLDYNEMWPLIHRIGCNHIHCYLGVSPLMGLSDTHRIGVFVSLAVSWGTCGRTLACLCFMLSPPLPPLVPPLLACPSLALTFLDPMALRAQSYAFLLRS